MSDNGGQKSWQSNTQYKGRYAKLPHNVLGNNLPLRGWKGDCYEGGIRVPAFVNWPGALKSGKMDPPVHIVDWMPTLCHLAGYIPEKDLQWDGINFWPDIVGSLRLIPNRTMYWKTPNASAVRSHNMKLIVYKNNRTELFDLSKDPYEKNNVVEKESQRAAELKALLKQIARPDRERKS